MGGTEHMISLPPNPPLQFGADYSEKALKARQTLRVDQRQCFDAPVDTQEALQTFAKDSQRFASIRNSGVKPQSLFQIGLQRIIRNFRKIRNDPTPLEKKPDGKDAREGMAYD